MTGLLLGLEGGDHREPVEVGHLDVEEHQVRRLRPDQVDRLAPVAGLAGDLDVLLAPEQLGEPTARRLLVVDDQRADAVHAE